ncbi:hypothetical protein, partial [Acidithiobacillus sp.]|uniref:hypothetical protein n=1 Tax=Acidithiobacillus sp. TaxID=1872118 RepID=UPI0025C6630A
MMAGLRGPGRSGLRTGYAAGGDRYPVAVAVGSRSVRLCEEKTMGYRPKDVIKLIEEKDVKFIDFR